MMTDRSSITVEVPADTPVADVERAMAAALDKLPSGSRVVMGRGGAAASTQEPRGRCPSIAGAIDGHTG